MGKLILVVFATILIASQSAAGSTELSYVDGSKPFLSIKDVNRQAEAWGTCASAYEIMAMILESQPAQAKQVKDFGRGASLAVMMSHVVDGMSSDITPEEFNSLWIYSKTLVDSIPEVSRTMMLAEAESLGEAGAEKFIEKITATIKVCVANLEGQQMYIDTWRDLAKSGLLTLPSN